jgi:hypothetical protein
MPPRAAGLLLEAAELLGHARQEVVELGQLHLQFSLAGAGALGEDVEDEARAVQHLGGDDLLQVLLLGGREVVVEDDGVQTLALGGLGDLLHLAAADERGGVAARPALDEGELHRAAGGLGEAPQLLQRGSRPVGRTRRSDADEGCAFHRKGFYQFNQPSFPRRRESRSSPIFAGVTNFRSVLMN